MMCVLPWRAALASIRKTSDAYRRTGNDEARKYTHKTRSTGISSLCTPLIIMRIRGRQRENKLIENRVKNYWQVATTAFYFVRPIDQRWKIYRAQGFRFTSWYTVYGLNNLDCGYWVYTAVYIKLNMLLPSCCWY